MSGAIELIVFDMDETLAILDRPRRLELLSRFSGRSADLIQNSIYASEFERETEAGKFPTGDEYLAEFNRRIGARLTREQWAMARGDAMTPIPETFAAAKRLKTSHRIATLTNNGSLLHECIASILPEAAALFGADFHASYEFRARKPDREVFERYARHYGVANDRVLFIDDTREYIEGARSVGWNAIHFSDPLRFDRELAGFGL